MLSVFLWLPVGLCGLVRLKGQHLATLDILSGDTRKILKHSKVGDAYQFPMTSVYTPTVKPVKLPLNLSFPSSQNDGRTCEMGDYRAPDRLSGSGVANKGSFVFFLRRPDTCHMSHAVLTAQEKGASAVVFYEDVGTSTAAPTFKGDYLTGLNLLGESLRIPFGIVSAATGHALRELYTNTPAYDPVSLDEELPPGSLLVTPNFIEVDVQMDASPRTGGALGRAAKRTDHADVNIYITPAKLEHVYILEDLARYAQLLTDHVTFSPIYYIFSTNAAQSEMCVDPIGKYCALPAEWTEHLSGRAISGESLRQFCVWTVNTSGFWAYVANIRLACYHANSDATLDPACSNRLAATLGLNMKALDQCNSYNAKAIYEKLQELSAENKSQLRISINGQEYSGPYTGLGIFSALCRVLSPSPPVCSEGKMLVNTANGFLIQSPGYLPSLQDVLAYKALSFVSLYLVIALFVVTVIAGFFLYRKTRPRGDRILVQDASDEAPVSLLRAPGGQ